MITKKRSKSPPKKSKKIVTNECTVSFSKQELVHLRDIMSIMCPSETNSTISQVLATLCERADTEAGLWTKIMDACSVMDVPVASDAPDFMIVPTSIPAMTVHLVQEQE